MMSSWRSLRLRVLAAFVLVAVPPVLLLALIITSNVTQTYHAAAAERLDHGIGAVSARIDDLRARAQRRVDVIADRRLAAANVEDEIRLADPAGIDHDLQALEILEVNGRTISSHHWPVSFGLPDQDETFPGDPSLRWQKVAHGYGYVERLTVTASRRVPWRGREVIVRGGFFLDGDLLPELAGPLGMKVGLYDANRQRWITPADSALERWKSPNLEPRQGETPLSDSSYQWRSKSLHPSLWIVVAIPATDVGSLVSNVRRLATFIAAGAMFAALLASIWLSGRISRPVRRLAKAARRLAAGGPPTPVSVYGPREINELAAAFNSMTIELFESRERLLQAERVAAWREMARRLAHELKNPLFPIQLSIETLQKAFEKDPDSAGSGDFPRLFRESCETLLEELRILQNVIDQFSSFSRMPRPCLRPIEVGPLITQVLSLYQSRSDSVSIDLAIEAATPLILADRDLLSRALGNLIANAFEAMPQGGVLRVRTGHHDGTVSIEIADTGPGLTEEERRTRLFTPYYTTKKGGTGLGLAIAQSIVSDHGGRIDVLSEPGNGTTFTLRLRAVNRVEEILSESSAPAAADRRDQA
ncbi:MAG: HAMP domain-containing protein [Vicinamibacteria bacterium]|nr:HAMP domain-containing protein [Vicinamibacteria bacterium]